MEADKYMEGIIASVATRQRLAVPHKIPSITIF